MSSRDRTLNARGSQVRWWRARGRCADAGRTGAETLTSPRPWRAAEAPRSPRERPRRRRGARAQATPRSWYRTWCSSRGAASPSRRLPVARAPRPASSARRARRPSAARPPPRPPRLARSSARRGSSSGRRPSSRSTYPAGTARCWVRCSSRPCNRPSTRKWLPPRWGSWATTRTTRTRRWAAIRWCRGLGRTTRRRITCTTLQTTTTTRTIRKVSLCGPSPFRARNLFFIHMISWRLSLVCTHTNKYFRVHSICRTAQPRSNFHSLFFVLSLISWLVDIGQ